MILPDNITETAIALKDQYFDLKGLAVYSTLGISTLRNYIREGKLCAYKVNGKILVKQSEFDKWIEGYQVSKKQDIEALADGVMQTLKRC